LAQFNQVPDDGSFMPEGWIQFTIGSTSYVVPAWK
jgi:hypothetical protein